MVDDDRSLPLFEEAEKKFQETAAHGMQDLWQQNVLRCCVLSVLSGTSAGDVLQCLLLYMESPCECHHAVRTWVYPPHGSFKHPPV